MRRRTTKNADADEVEEMLRAAEDDLLLNLTRNTHATQKQPQNPDVSSASVFDSDLDRRFDALKSTTTTPTLPSASSSEISTKLAARFAALKGGPTATSSGYVSMEEDPIRRVEEGKSKDEVEEIMQWALDAVRLGSTDKDVDESSEDSDDEESDDDERKEEKKKGKGKGKGKGKDRIKW